MALIVEDGTGVVNANSYSSLEYADEYFTLTGNSAWGGGATQKEQALILATRYIETFEYQGVRQFPEIQLLKFPRKYVYVDGVVQDGIVPRGIKNACCEYAVKALTQDLFPYDENQGGGYPEKHVVIGSTSKGAIEVEVDTTGGKLTKKSFPSADILLRPFLMPVRMCYYR